MNFLPTTNHCNYNQLLNLYSQAYFVKRSYPAKIVDYMTQQ